jgi:hypothetical protein
MRRFAIVLTVTAAFALALGIAPARAGGREVVFTDHFDVLDPIVNCGTFTIVDHAVADVTGTLYFDKSGNPYRLRVRIDGTDSLSSSAGGPTYSSPNVLTYTEDYRQDRAWKTGVAFQTTVPQHGAVFTDVGIIKFDADGMTAHGQHVDSPEDFTELCDAFA